MPELYAQLGLTSDEYDRICVLQGREPPTSSSRSTP